jgi:hypothetical protein
VLHSLLSPTRIASSKVSDSPFSTYSAVRIGQAVSKSVLSGHPENIDAAAGLLQQQSTEIKLYSYHHSYEKT